MSETKPYTDGALRAAKRIQRLMEEFAESNGHNHIVFDEEACAEIITYETETCKTMEIDDIMRSLREYKKKLIEAEDKLEKLRFRSKRDHESS